MRWDRIRQWSLDNKVAAFLLLALTILSIYWLSAAFEDTNETQGYIRLNDHALMLEDKEHQWTIDDILTAAGQSRFQSLPPGLSNYGLTHSAFWIKVVIPRRFHKAIRTQPNTPWLLEYSRKHITFAEMYVVKRNVDEEKGIPLSSPVIDIQSADNRTPLDERVVPYDASVYLLTVDQLLNCDIYLRVYNKPALFGNLTLHTEEAFWHGVIIESGAMGLFLGGLLLMFFYNLNAFLTTRNIVYVYYVGINTAVALVVFIDLWMPLSLEQETYEKIAKAVPLLIWTVWIFTLLYCREYLETKVRMPLLDNVLKLFLIIVVSAFFITLSQELETSIRFGVHSGILYVTLISVLSFIAAKRKSRSDYEFAIGWTFSSFGIGVYAAVAMGFVEPGVAALTAAPFGVLMQGFVLSLSLASRLQEANKQVTRERYRLLNLSLQYSRKLEQKVEARIQALSVKSEELGKAYHEKQQVHELTSRYLDKVSELINNAGEGFLSFGPALAVEEGYSLECLRIFGGDRLDRTVSELLAQGDVQKKHFLEKALGALFNNIDDVDSHDLYLGLLPKELRLGSGYYKVTYKPLKQKIMLTLKDITAEKQEIKRAELARLALEFVVYALDNRQEVVQLISEFRAFLAETPPKLFGATSLDEACRELNRAVHTFKSLFAQASAPHLPEALHTLESQIGKNRAYLVTSTELIKLFRQSQVQTAFDRDLGILVEKLGVDYLDQTRAVRLEAAKIDALADAVAAECGKDTSVYRLILNLKHHCLSALLEPHLKMASNQAIKQEKMLRIQMEDPQCLRVDPVRLGDLLHSLVHVFRNVVDHGVETPEEREEAGKPETATLTVTLSQDAEHVYIRIEDDGRGIDAEALREKMVSKQWMSLEEAENAPDEVMLQTIFLDGVTSRKTVSMTAGRGVGLSAVKAEVDKVGGEISVNSTFGKGTCFTFTLPV